MFWIAFILTVFPQAKVDGVCLKNREKKIVSDTPRHIAQTSLSVGEWETSINRRRGFFAESPVFSGREDFSFTSDKKGTLYIGDTVLIDTDYVQDGDIIIYGNGMLLVDNAKLTLSGHLYAQNQGQTIFKNGAHLSFKQFYLSQYFTFLVDSAKFEAIDATIDGNGIPLDWVELRDYSTYIARRVHFTDWVFRKVFNNSILIMEDVDYIGDLLVNDSCRVSFLHCAKLLPWLEIPDGSVIDIQFPGIDTVLHFEFSDTQPGIAGIDYTMTIDTCYNVWWGVGTHPGCSLTVTNSLVMGSMMRIPGSDTITFYGIMDSTFYTDLTVPLPDRHHRLINSAVYSWQPYALEQTVFYIDSCTFGEMMGKGNSVTYATRCTCDGIWLHLGVVDNAFGSFTDGMVKSFVSVWQNATLLLSNTSVICISPWSPPPMGPNLAHNHSYLLAVNSYFEYEPEAMDTSLVMVTAIDSPATGMVDTTIDIYGSAWIDAGPFNPIAFDRYKLYWTYKGDSIWTLIRESTSQFHNDTLGKWNTSGMSAGEYDLRLTIWDSAGDSLTAFRDITLLSPGTEEENKPQSWKLAAHQEGSELRISFSTPIDRQVTLDIFDIAGRKIKNLFRGKAKGKIDIACNPNSGVYFVRLSGERTIVRKVVWVY